MPAGKDKHQRASMPAPYWLPAEHLNLGQSELRFAVIEKHSGVQPHGAKREYDTAHLALYLY